MVFSSLLFLFRFLPAVLILYFIAPRRFRNFILFITSLIFYAWGEPVYVVLMLFSTVVDFTHGMLVDRYKKQGNMKAAKRAVASAMIINLALLGFFKYADFIIGNINALTGASIPLLNLALPIGISFYTFQTMSYTIDVYRGEAQVQKNIISFGAYVVLFPQLIAGPIVQYKTIAQQLVERKETTDQFSCGVMRFMSGLGKKVLLANNIGLLWDQISANPAGEIPVLMSWIGITAYAFQIYFDFSGYSDMAIGLGQMFGFRFLENFDYPYMSKSITEFWRRWHISLGSWFREYVYIPMGGNRVGVLKHIRNLLVVWTLTGLWHGASWNFVVWGFYYGVLLIGEKYILRKAAGRIPVLGTACTLLLVLIGWVFFFSPSLGAAVEYLSVMAGLGSVPLTDDAGMYYLLSSLALFAISWLCCVPQPFRLMDRLWKREGGKTGLYLFYLALFVLCTAYLIHDTYNPFLYFRF